MESDRKAVVKKPRNIKMPVSSFLEFLDSFGIRVFDIKDGFVTMPGDQQSFSFSWTKGRTSLLTALSNRDKEKAIKIVQYCTSYSTKKAKEFVDRNWKDWLKFGFSHMSKECTTFD